MPVTKKCQKCKKRKMLRCFGRDNRTHDSLKVWCKSCRKADRARHYRENRNRIIAQTTAWQKANPKAVKKIHREWCKRHPEKRRAITKAWFEKNAKRWSESQRRYRAANPERCRSWDHAKRARKLKAAGRYDIDDIFRLIRKQKHRCAYCGASLRKFFQIDHKTPLCRGGTNWPRNIHLTCAYCNQSKGHRTHAEFLKLLDY